VINRLRLSRTRTQSSGPPGQMVRSDMTTIVDRVKLVVVHRDSPDVETELGIFPSKDAAMPAFQEAIAKHDPLRATIEPVEAKATPENSASYQWSPGRAR
jgi:hypothetical protein